MAKITTPRKKDNNAFRSAFAIVRDQLNYIFGRDMSLVDAEARNLILSDPKNKKKLISALDKTETSNDLSDKISRLQIKFKENGKLIID